MADEQTKPDGLNALSRVPHIRRKRKRNDIDNINVIRKKQSKGVKAVEQEVDDSVDTISELPESVIHHILSLIRSAKEAARTSILSKKWRDAWKSFSVLTFDERSFLKTEVDLNSDKRRQMFIDFIDNSLQSHLVRNLGIYKLVIRITAELGPYLNRWLGMVGENVLSELDIHVEDKKLRRYQLPLFMHYAKTLTGLRLHGLNWSNFEALKFNNLQKLYLRRLHVDKQIIQQLVSTSPLIMDLRILECQGLIFFEISGLQKLERVDLYRCHGLKSIELKVTSLQTFWYCAKKSSRCKLNLESCTSLKRLTLEDSYVTDTSLNKLLSSLPVLEKLDLSRCNKLKYVIISNSGLRSLALRSCNNLKIVDILAKNPCSFDYKNRRMAFILGVYLKEAKLSLGSTEIDGVADIPFRNLRIFSFLRTHCKGFKIIVQFHKNIIIHDESKDFFLPPLSNLKIQVIKSSTDAKDLLDSLLTTWQPERIMVVSPPSSDVPKALLEIKREEEPSCCRFNSSNKKCWRHFLEEAKIVDIAEIEGISDWFHAVNLLGGVDQVISMRLHWDPSVHLGKVKHNQNKDTDQEL